MTGIRAEAKDRFLVEEVPWDRCPEGVSVLGASKDGSENSLRR
ncbi:hypothetical protein ACFWN1_13850 [Streptomyces sp. NPDC058459]